MAAATVLPTAYTGISTRKRRRSIYKRRRQQHDAVYSHKSQVKGAAVTRGRKRRRGGTGEIFNIVDTQHTQGKKRRRTRAGVVGQRRYCIRFITLTQKIGKKKGRRRRPIHMEEEGCVLCAVVATVFRHLAKDSWPITIDIGPTHVRRPNT